MSIAFKKELPTDVNNKTKFQSWFERNFKNLNSTFYFFLLMVVMGLIFFIDSLLQNQFTTLFGGDYTAQQLSFYTNGYDDWWTFFKTGKFVFFDTNTYLGASNIGSNSFYYLFDPFFLPILLCPREFIAQGMVFLTIFKIATAGMFFRAYMLYMGASEKASRISAFAYAFCGWMAWFLWFNHMTEIMIAFPIMLWGVERTLREKRPWLLMFGIFVMGITNYFFLIGMTIAAFFYAIFRWIQRFKLNETKENFKILGIGFVAFLTGLLLTGFAVLPSVMVALQAPRAANGSYLEGLKTAISKKNVWTVLQYLFTWKSFGFAYNSDTSFRMAFPLINFFFPCASCRGTPLTTYEYEYYDNTATNIYCFVPMMLAFIPAFTRAMKQKKWSVLVAAVLFTIALETPLSYYLFFGFTAPYGRWELFFITSFITFSGLHIDHMKDDTMRIKIISYLSTAAMIVVSGIVAQALIDNYEHIYQRSDYISATGAIFIMLGYTTIVFFVLAFSKKEEKRNSWMLTFIMFEAAVMGFLTIEGHWCTTFYEANNGLEYNNDLYQLNQQIQKTDKSYYRCWSYLQNEGARNDGMRNNYNGLGCFHSLYNFNINNFVNWTSIQDGETFGGGGSWAGSYVWKNADIDRFLGVKYYFIQGNSPQWGWMGDLAKNSDGSDYYQYNAPLDYEKTNEFKSDRFVVLKDKNHLDFAYGTDKLISYETKNEKTVEARYDNFYFYDELDVLVNDELLLEGGIVNTRDAAKIKADYPNLQVENVTIKRQTIYKQKLLNLSYHLYDLEGCSDGNNYTVNTFFEQDAINYLNNHHALTAKQLANIDNGFANEIANGSSENDKYGRYVSVIKPLTGSYFEEMYDETGYSVYVPYYYDEEIRGDIYLISDEGKIITWDRHQDDKYNCGGLRYRGFYVHETKDKDGNYTTPKLAKIVFAHREKRAPSRLDLQNVYYETYTAQKTRVNHLYENKVYDVRYGTNTFKFKTNYSNNLFVVTQMPYEDGWTIKAKLADGTKKNIDVQITQGGYVGFVSEKGETQYVLEYYPKYLKEGKLISAAGLTIFFVTFVSYMYFQEERKAKRITLKELEIN